MPQPVHTLRTVFFTLTVAVSLGFGVAQASASPAAPPARAAACDEGTCDYLCGGLGQVPRRDLHLLLSAGPGERNLTQRSRGAER